MDLLSSSLKQISQLIKQKKISVLEVCEFFLNRIEKYQSLNAVITVNHQALKIAEHMDQHLTQYMDKPLAGVPILVKDVFCTKGLRTTASSKMLQNFIPPYSAEVVCRLEQAGAIILGKCNQDEFAMGCSNENSFFGQVLNPWNKNCVPGGSSGGSASAVAAGLAPAALGSDTGGSIRQPAGFCNLVGIKPTYGRISRYGMIAYASSLDQAGPMTVNVEDSAYLLRILSGKDHKDSTSLNDLPPLWDQKLNSDIQSMKIGCLNKEQQEHLCSTDVLRVMNQVEEVFEKHVNMLAKPHLSALELAVPAYYLVSTSEASSNLARYDGVRYGYRQNFSQKKLKNMVDFYCQTRGSGFGSEVKRRILMGTFCLSHGYYDQYYNKACQVRRYIRDELMQLFSKFSVLMMPISATPAWKIGEAPSGSLKSYLNDQFTVVANLAGLPALSVPAGFSSDGLPIGVQLIARHFDEQSLFNAAWVIQKELQAVGKRPHGY